MTILYDPITAPGGGPSTSGGAPTGTNISNPPALPGQQPVNPGKPPGWGPIYAWFYSVATSYLNPVDPDFEAKRKLASHASEVFADGTIADFAKFGVALSDMPRPRPPGWH